MFCIDVRILPVFLQPLEIGHLYTLCILFVRHIGFMYCIFMQYIDAGKYNNNGGFSLCFQWFGINNKQYK